MTALTFYKKGTIYVMQKNIIKLYKSIRSKPTVVLLSIFLVIMALLPIHALLSTWAISNFGHETLFKAWKEILLFFVALPLTLWLVYKNKKIKQIFNHEPINNLIAAFAAVSIVMIFFRDIPPKVEVAGLVFDLRFFAMFLVGQVLALKIAKREFSELVLRVVFWGGLVVVAFGALQVLLLPNDFLRHFGYQNSIIPPYFTVDNNQNIVRILSTLRGPNALGAYLVFWLPFLALVTKRMWSVAVKFRIWAVIIWFASLVTLFGSRSRSGWLGAVVAVGMFILFSVNSIWRKRLILLGFAGVAAFSILLAANWNSPLVQTTLKHRDPNENSSVNSDDQRSDSLVSAVKAILANPAGTGPGTVNLASTYGDKPIIVENYYLQIGQEFGILGLTLFMAILILVGIKLWQLRHNDIAAALLASFLGLALVNMLLPAWSDETVSMLWWGLAGVTIYSYNVKHKKQKDDK